MIPGPDSQGPDSRGTESRGTEASVSTCLAQAARILADHGIPDARLDAEVWLAHVLDLERTALITHPERRLEVAEIRRFQEGIEKRSRACPLACRHCRAEAIADRHPDELTTSEGKDLLNQIRAMGTPVCVLSGGDPLKRPDLIDLVRCGNGLGLRMATIPAGSDDLTRDKLAALKEAGPA